MKPSPLPAHLRRAPDEPADAYLRRLNAGLREALDLAQRIAAEVDTLTADALPSAAGLKGLARLTWWAENEMSHERPYTLREVAAASGVPYEQARKYVTTLERRRTIWRDYGADEARLSIYHPAYRPAQPSAWAGVEVARFLRDRPHDRFNVAALAVRIGGGYTSRHLQPVLDALTQDGLIRDNGTQEYGWNA